MEMANLETEYDDKSGKGAGATSTGLDKLNDAISGKNMKSAEFGDGQKDKAMRIIESELAQDRNVRKRSVAPRVPPCTSWSGLR
jgi:hypothetical protein